MIKKGQRVEIKLLSTKTAMEERHANGILGKLYVGTALNDLKVGGRFSIGIGYGDITFSPTQEVLGDTSAGFFNTENSSYSFKVLKDAVAP